MQSAPVRFLIGLGCPTRSKRLRNNDLNCILICSTTKPAIVHTALNAESVFVAQASCSRIFLLAQHQNQTQLV